MARFSERYGYTPVKDMMQLESMDGQLRNGLWSAFYDTVAQHGKNVSRINMSSDYFYLLVALWKKFYKLPTDTLPTSTGSYDKSLGLVRNRFNKMEWFVVYNFLEFVAQNISSRIVKNQYVQNCNQVLRQEMAGYRFVDDEIARITSDEQIAEIEKAISGANANPVSSHLKRALELLSDRAEPDYRNSIKESISAVEALCVNLTGYRSNYTGTSSYKVGQRQHNQNPSRFERSF